MIMNRPSMRNAKIAASDVVARSSGAVMREDVADGLDIGNEFRMIGMSARQRAAEDQDRRPGGLSDDTSGPDADGRRAARNRAARPLSPAQVSPCCHLL
ncbi:hypothetical protein BconGalA64_53740 [Burkholderia contaminans]|nr:hypothetical protein BconGalA64_53740 [Burkholderia contaminans]